MSGNQPRKIRGQPQQKSKMPGTYKYCEEGLKKADKGLRGKPGFLRGAVSPGALIPAQILNAGSRRKEKGGEVSIIMPWGK